jgi:DNA-binding NarL/FixJ family response regulator
MKTHTSNPAKPPLMTNSIRALVVDDSPVMLRALTGLLSRQHRFQVVGTAADGRQAVLAAASLTPQLVLVNLHLPYLNGAQVTRCLKKFENPPVVFMVSRLSLPAARACASHILPY